MSKDHPWTGKTHYYSDLLPHRWFIAMCRTFIASRLIWKKFTFFNSLKCVIQQVITFITQLIGCIMMYVTIHFDHHLYGFFLSGNSPAHDQFMPRINVSKNKEKTGDRNRELGRQETGIGNQGGKSEKNYFFALIGEHFGFILIKGIPNDNPDNYGCDEI